MGIFDLLFGSRKRSNVEVAPDHIWMTTDAKFAGLAREAEDRSRSESAAILLVAHFQDVLVHLNKLAEELHGRVSVTAVPAEQLQADIAAGQNLDESTTIDIIVGERHPLPSVDDRLEEFAEELPCRCRFSHHVSLDDPIMNIFAGEPIKELLRKLGMSENEAIESKMVSRRIRAAQQKIEGRSFSDARAESAATWFELNCPDLAKR